MSNLPSNPSKSFIARNAHLYGSSATKPTMAVVEGKGKRLRQSSKPLMNKLEMEFYEVLKTRYPAEVITCQAIRVRLGNGIWFKVDFFILGWKSGLVAYEVKGPHAFRGGFENLKVAASIYPQIKWILAWKEQGQFREQVILP